MGEVMKEKKNLSAVFYTHILRQSVAEAFVLYISGRLICLYHIHALMRYRYIIGGLNETE